MTKDQCISITDLRRDAKKCFEGLSEVGIKYVFVNNRPKAVIIDIDDFEEYYNAPVELVRMRDEDVPPEVMKKIERSRKKSKNEFINIPC